MDTEDFHFKFKIVVLGDKHVGKSSLIDAIAMNYGKILEIEVSEELSLKATSYMEEGQLYNIQYWEIPGYLKNMNYFFRYCLGATAAIYVFDLSKRSSLEKIDNWITETEKCNIPVKVLVGNKLDIYENSKNAVDR